MVFLFTYRLVKHLVYLEKFIRVCSWCRKVCYRHEWMPLEEYFKSGFHVGTTHGICADCLQKAKDDTTRFFKCPTSSTQATPTDSPGQAAEPSA